MKNELLAQSDYQSFHYNIRGKFDAALPNIQRNIVKVYKEMTDGGDIELEKINEYGYDLEGLSLQVRPPFSCFVQKEQLSGGQKTLIALAVVFGLHFHRAAPFFLLDQVDANLDRTNAEMLGRYLSKVSKTQIIMITHRKEGVEYAPHFILLEKKILGPLKEGVIAKHYNYEEALQVKDNMMLSLRGIKKKWQRRSKMLNGPKTMEEKQQWLKNEAEKKLMEKYKEDQISNAQNKPPQQNQFLFFAKDKQGKRKSFNLCKLLSRVKLEEKRETKPVKLQKSREESPLSQPVKKGKLSQILRRSSKRKEENYKEEED